MKYYFHQQMAILFQEGGLTASRTHCVCLQAVTIVSPMGMPSFRWRFVCKHLIRQQEIAEIELMSCALRMFFRKDFANSWHQTALMEK